MSSKLRARITCAVVMLCVVLVSLWIANQRDRARSQTKWYELGVSALLREMDRVSRITHRITDSQRVECDCVSWHEVLNENNGAVVANVMVTIIADVRSTVWKSTAVVFINDGIAGVYALDDDGRVFSLSGSHNYIPRYTSELTNRRRNYIEHERVNAQSRSEMVKSFTARSEERF